MAEQTIFSLIGADKAVKALKWGWDAARWRKAWHDYVGRVTEDYGKSFVLGTSKLKKEFRLAVRDRGIP